MYFFCRVEKKTKTVKGLPAVPESVLKHRKRRDANRASLQRRTIKKKAQQQKQRKEIFKRAEQYVKEYRLKEREEIRLGSSS
jgi:large subunit ribosomal protein L7e